MNKTNLHGFPDFNGEFESKEKEKKQKSSPKDSPSMNDIPDFIKNSLTSIAKNIGIDLDFLSINTINDDGEIEELSSLKINNEDESDNDSEDNNADIFSIANSYSFSALKNVANFMQPFIMFPDCSVREDFFNKFGEKERYTEEELSKYTKIIIPNGTKENRNLFQNIKSLELVKENEKYMLFKTEPIDQEKEPFIVALFEILSEGEEKKMVFYVPHFGNTLFMEDNDLFQFSKVNFDLYDENGVFKLTPDIEKIEAEIELLMVNISFYGTKLAEFGKVIQSHKPERRSSNSIYLGEVVSNNSEKAKRFLKDFNLDYDPYQRKFNFYLVLDEIEGVSVLNALKDFIGGIDINVNELFQNSELMQYNDGIGIRLNIETLIRNILKWREE